MADFTAQVTDANASPDRWPAPPAGLLGAAGVLVLVGVRPHPAEYRRGVRPRLLTRAAAPR